MAITTGMFKGIFGWNDPKQMMNTAQEKTLETQAQDVAATALELYRKEKDAQMRIAQQRAYMDSMRNAYGGMAGAQTVPPPDPNTKPLPALRMEDLEGPAGKLTLTELADLWRARWGAAWVKRGEITDEFYTVCAQRLLSASKLEAHELANGVRVYRLI